MAAGRTLTERYGNRDVPADHPGFRVVYALGPGEDSVIVQLDGGSWPTGLVLTPQGSTNGVRFHNLPNSSTCTALGQQEALNVQGLSWFALYISTVGAAGTVQVEVRAHEDFQR